jgi:tetratricopeptide (TPR) repeat protein
MRISLLHCAPLFALSLGSAACASSSSGPPGVADDIRREYEERTYVADQDSAPPRALVWAAEAARYMRKLDEADLYLRIAEMSDHTEGDHNQILRERLWLELARGGGVEGVQTLFLEQAKRRDFPPTELAGWVYSFPELLVGGRFDPVIEKLSRDAADPAYRCDCFAAKAWMHRAAGRLEKSRAHWDSLVAEAPPEREFADPYDEADFRALRARNLARAGRVDEARAELERALAVDISAFESVFIRRRRAQYYAELGDVQAAVADLEFLLSVPSPVTVHTLESRMAWSLIRDDPAFQAMLQRARAGS